MYLSSEDNIIIAWEISLFNAKILAEILAVYEVQFRK
jgi:hypothetical protein